MNTHHARHGLKYVLLSALVLFACAETEYDNGTSTKDAVTPGPEDLASVEDPRSKALCTAEEAKSCLNTQQSCTLDSEDNAQCIRCDTGFYPKAPEATCTPLEGKRHQHAFDAITLEPGEEVGSVCLSWVLNNPTEMWIHAVEFENDGGHHHSNWVFVPEDYNGWPTEPWYNCYQEGFMEVAAAIEGGVLYAQSTQIERELQKFTSGAAVRIPPYSRVMAPVHLLNYLPTPLTTQTRLTLYELAPEEVTIKLAPLVLTNRALALPPEARSIFRADCDFARSFSTYYGPMRAKLHYVLPHYHDRATTFSLRILGGERDGELLFEDTGYSAEPFGRVFDPPIDLDNSTGLSFACTYDNPSAKVVKWGIGDREMCDMLGFVESPAAFIGLVTEADLSEQGDGSYISNGECVGTAVEFAQDKDGGEGL